MSSRFLMKRTRVVHGVTDLVGDTPLVEVRRIARHIPKVSVHGKAEWYNPSGSVKDRPVLSILRDAEERGVLTKDKTILDATSGNAGASYAMLGSVLEYDVCLTIP
ncbi:MAG: pyridoxal-phosphate dependent enzyme, partial [Candidatus Geothermarchaeales archaeon]